MPFLVPARVGVLVVTSLLALGILGCDARAVRQGSAPQASQPSLLIHREAAGPLDSDDVEGLLAQELAPEPLPATAPGAFPSYPLPEGDQPPLGPGLFRTGSFGAPLPRSPVWNPAGTKRVGIQAGHWLTNDVPYELRRLSPGTSGGGWAEWEVNLLIARRVAALLEEAGIEVDVLPSTIPVRYRAHAFISIHADGDASGRMHGYKIARPGFSSIPEADDELVAVMYREYGAATRMPRDADEHISRRMIFYYAFNTRRYHHAIDLGAPAAIIETGFLTNQGDRAFLTGQPDLAARGVANGVLRFLELELGAGR